ncbi:hypothetical protein MK489_24045 [Myxococcota bacterium]|nr:hypothetical protein [Myxococcota bacterium]
MTDTSMTRAAPEGALSAMLASTPLRRMREASEGSSFVTGQWLSPNGAVFIG